MVIVKKSKWIHLVLFKAVVPSAITHSFFELQTPDFTWKLIWTIATKWASMQRQIFMESMDHQISYNSDIF